MRAFVVGAAVVVVGCGGEPESTPPPVAVAVAPAPAPVSEPPPPPIDLSLGDGFEMRGTIRDGRITLVPIVATGELRASPMLTLDRGMQSRQVLVREVRGEWDVGTVRITNRSRMPLLALRGELITGAMQDRVLAESIVIEPGQTEEVAVRCVEEDRDHGTKQFRSGNAIAELSLRRVLAHTDQAHVWREVDAINARLGIHEDTKSYRHAAARHARETERTSRIAAQLAAHPDHARIVGVAVAVDGQVLAIDRFASPAVFQSLQGKLLGSYVASEVGDPGAQEGRRLTPDAVRALAAVQATATTVASFDAVRPLHEAVLSKKRNPADPWE